MFRTLMIMAFVALNLNAVFAENVFTEEKVRNDAGKYLKAHPELNGKVHPAYAISHAYLNSVGEVFGKSADETLKNHAKQTAWKILTEGYGWKGFDKSKTANPLEARFAFYSLGAIFSNDGYKVVTVPNTTRNSSEIEHLNLINALLGIAQKIGSQDYKSQNKVPAESQNALQTWAAITNRGNRFVNSSALQMYQQIFKAAAPHMIDTSRGIGASGADAGGVGAQPPPSQRRPSLAGAGRPDDVTGDPTGVSQSGVGFGSSHEMPPEAHLSIPETLALYKAQWDKKRSPKMRLQTLEAIAVHFKNLYPSDSGFQQTIDAGLEVAKKAFDPDSYKGNIREKNHTKLQFIVSLNNIFQEASYTTHHKKDLEEFSDIAKVAIHAFSVNPLGDARQEIAQIKDLQRRRESGEFIASSKYHPDPIKRTEHLGNLFKELHPLDATYWDRIESVTALTERAIHRETYGNYSDIKPTPELQSKMDSEIDQGKLIIGDDPSHMDYQNRKLRAYIRFELVQISQLDDLIENPRIESPQARKDFIDFATLARDAVVKNERYIYEKDREREARLRAEIKAEQIGQAGAAQQADTKRRAEQAEAVVRKIQQAFRKKQAQSRADEAAKAAAAAAVKISPEEARIQRDIGEIERTPGMVGFSKIQTLAPLYKQLVSAEDHAKIDEVLALAAPAFNPATYTGDEAEQDEFKTNIIGRLENLMFAEQDGSNLYNFLDTVCRAVLEFKTPADVHKEIAKAASERDESIRYTTDKYQQRIDEISQSKNQELKHIEAWKTRMNESGKSPSEIDRLTAPEYQKVERVLAEALGRVNTEFGGSLEASLAPIHAQFDTKVAAIGKAQRQASLGYQDVPPAA